MWRPKKAIFAGSILLSTSLLIAGCTTKKTTTTARSATEELLLSTATDHALQNLGLEAFAGRKVFLDATYFDSIDSKYVLGSMRDAVSRAGGLLVDNATNSELILEARSGALAINESDTMLGLPSIGVPIPLAGTVVTPEISFYKSVQQRSYAKFALLAIVKESRAHVYSSGPLDGKSYDKHSRILFYKWKRTDVPEKYSDPETAQKYQTWSRQIDLGNLPANTNTPANTNASPK